MTPATFADESAAESPPADTLVAAKAPSEPERVAHDGDADSAALPGSQQKDEDIVGEAKNGKKCLLM